MRYEIVSIESLEDPRHVLAEVHHWHRNSDYGVHAPDFVEHHAIVLPPSLYLKRDNIGQLFRTDGQMESPYKEDANGEWDHWEPQYGDPDYVWLSQDYAVLIGNAIEGRAKKIAASRETGSGLLHGNMKPPVVPVLNSAANFSTVRALIGKPKLV